MNTNLSPITPLPQHPFVKGPAIPVDPFQKPTMTECLASLERIRCVMAYMLSSSPTTNISEPGVDKVDPYLKDALAGKTFLVSSLHESLRYIGEQMMELNHKERANIEQQLREIDPIAADLFGYQCSERRVIRDS